jgi:hypothetical protein
LRPGTYEWTWGTGPDQNFTIAIGALGAAVPESSTWVMMLLGFAGLGFAGYRHGWKGRNAPDVWRKPRTARTEGRFRAVPFVA